LPSGGSGGDQQLRRLTFVDWKGELSRNLFTKGRNVANEHQGGLDMGNSQKTSSRTKPVLQGECRRGGGKGFRDYRRAESSLTGGIGARPLRRGLYLYWMGEPREKEKSCKVSEYSSRLA